MMENNINKCNVVIIKEEPDETVSEDAMKRNSDYKQMYSLKLKRGKSIQHNFCRVCLKSGKIPIFGSEKYKNLHKVLTTFAAIQVDKKDDLPKYLCVTCYYFLKNAVTFRNTAHKSEKILQKRIAKSISALPQSEYKTLDKNEILSSQISPSQSIKYEDDYITQSDLNMTNEKVRKSNKALQKKKVSKQREPILTKIKPTDNKNTKSKPDNIKMEKKWSYCKRCDLKFDTYISSYKHFQSDEHINFKVECSLCKRVYKAQYIQVHMLRHRLDPTKVFICEVCGRSYALESQLKRHKAMHSNVLAFKCTLCPYRGRYKESVRYHMRVHTGEKPYACTQCPARFGCQINLHRHKLRHSMKRDHVCKSCKKSFYTKTEVNSHYKAVHLGLKEHVCRYCNKAFLYKNKMVKHQMKEHKRVI